MFITLEGGEGTGKTTQIQEIANFLEQAGCDTVITREPGGTQIGKEIRAVLLNPENRNISPMCEFLLYMADREQHLQQIILPALRDGKTVLCDRFNDSTTVYQEKVRDTDIALLTQIHGIKINMGEVSPDLTILLDLDPVIGLERTFKDINKKKRIESESRFEQKSLMFHEKVRQGYLQIAADEPERFFIVDAAQEPWLVSDKIIDYLQYRFPELQTENENLCCAM